MSPSLDYIFKTYFPIGWDKNGQKIQEIAEIILKETDPHLADLYIFELEKIANSPDEIALLIAEYRGFIFNPNISLDEEKKYLISLAEEFKKYMVNANDYPWIVCVLASDFFAGHSDDPESFTDGVEDSEIGEDLIPICAYATELYPHIPRLWFQLGRAYWVNGYYESALEAFLKACKSGHGASFAYIAYATENGIDGILEANKEEAYQLYIKAVESGFEIAQPEIDRIELELEEEPQLDQSPLFLHYPDILDKSAEGDFFVNNKNLQGLNLIIYLSRALEGMSFICPEIEENKFLKKHLERDILNDLVPVEHIDEIYNRMFEGDLKVLCENAYHDGSNFATSLGCYNEKIQKCVNNIAIFLSDESILDINSNSKTIN